MELFIKKPSIDFYTGIKVTRETELEYENENVKQRLSDLHFESTTNVKGDNFESVYHTKITLEEGDILIFEEEGRGYIKPAFDTFVTVAEAICDLENIKDIGGEADVQGE